MTPSRRRTALAVVVATLALAVIAALGVAGRTLRQLDELRMRVSTASVPVRDAKNWAPAESFSCDLKAPGDDLRTWSRQLADARDERLPAPPVALVAWLDAHAADVDALVARVRAMGPIDLPDTGNNLASGRNRTLHVIDVGRALSLLVAAAGVAAFQGQHELAEARLLAAWPLVMSLLDLSWSGGVSESFLGALRAVRRGDAQAWLERLDHVDQRNESAEQFVTEARRIERQVHAWAERSVPDWLPVRLRVVAVRFAEIPPALAQGRDALARLDAGDELLSQDRCGNPAGTIGPSWTRDITMPRWLPSARRARIEDLLARTARRMGSLNLTREVIALRAGMSGIEPCGPRVRVTRDSDGRLTATVEAPPEGLGADPMWIEGATTFTFSAPPVSTPVMASAPGH